MAHLHPDLDPLRDLVGTWSGRGHGEYPTIDPFDYEETVTFGHGGKAFLVYLQRTFDPGSGRPMHTETGYVRVPAPGTVELVVAQPTGIVEVAEGRLTTGVGVSGTPGAGSVRLRTTATAKTATAKTVDAIERDLDWDGDSLVTVVRMAAVGVPMTHHLRSELVRSPAP
ncbi:MAG: FABP family protein [Actinomycetota bacterium]|jgi:hypothetical protein|nr:FABP family protein [Actinomycetota bacterium]MDA8342053.1 FABP family protein [Actinomycetota bacterium]